MGSKVGAMIKELVVHHDRVLNLVLENFGNNTNLTWFLKYCAILRLSKKKM